MSSFFMSCVMSTSCVLHHVSCFMFHASFRASCFMFRSSCRVASCHASCHALCFVSMCLSCLIVDAKRVTASTSVDTIGMRSQNHEGRHGPRKHESCFMACFMLYVIYVTFHALGHALCLASCLASCFMACFMSTPEFMHDVSCFAFHASFCMPYGMLLRVMFYGMLDAPYPVFHVLSCRSVDNR